MGAKFGSGRFLAADNPAMTDEKRISRYYSETSGTGGHCPLDRIENGHL